MDQMTMGADDSLINSVTYEQVMYICAYIFIDKYITAIIKKRSNKQ